MAEQESPDPQQFAAHAERLRSHLELVSSRLEVLEGLRDDKGRALRTLQSVQSSSDGDEVLFPVGGDTFVNAHLAGNDEVITGVGAGYAMPRPVKDTIETLEKDLEKLGGEVEDLRAQASRLEAEYSAVVQNIQMMQSGKPE